jgi:hypothetical protein
LGNLHALTKLKEKSFEEIQKSFTGIASNTENMPENIENLTEAQLNSKKLNRKPRR